MTYNLNKVQAHPKGWKESDDHKWKTWDFSATPITLDSKSEYVFEGDMNGDYSIYTPGQNLNFLKPKP